MNETTKRNLGIGILGLIIAFLLFATIGRLLADARGVPYGIVGLILWSAALIAAFTVGLLYFAQYVLPQRGGEGWANGINMIWRHYNLATQTFMNNLLSGSSETTSSGRGRRQTRKAAAAIRREIPSSFEIVQAGLLQSNQVLALAQGGGFSRAAGPGFVIMFRNEAIARVLDLRPHVRRQPVRTNTRDGIPVETTITVIFRVRQNPLDYPDETMPHPYDRDAIFHVSYASSIDVQDQLRPWQDQITPRAAAILGQEIARYPLDTLYQADGGGITLIDDISRQVRNRLDRTLTPDGIEVIAVNIDLFQFPESVTTQRIYTWQADWQQSIERQQATSDAEAIRRINSARARVQIELIQNITQNIENMRRTSPNDLSEIITLRMIEAMEEAASDVTLRALIPQPVISNLMETSSQMLTLINQKSGKDTSRA